MSRCGGEQRAVETRSLKMILLPALLLLLWGEAARCLEDNGGFSFDGDIRHFAVATNTVYVATEERLYQLSHDLTLVQSLTQRGVLTSRHQTNDAHFTRVVETEERNATLRINILLPLVEEGSLISCGVIQCRYCEVLDLKDISHVRHREHIQVGSLWTSSAFVSFLVEVEDVEKKRTETFILTASQHYEPKKSSCPSETEAVNLYNTNNNQKGSIFALTDGATSSSIKLIKGNAEFVDGFQITVTIYLFSNLPSSDKNNKVRLIWLEGKGSKQDTLRSLRGATLSLSGAAKGSKLLASAEIPGGPPVLWSGVFSVDGGPTNTELVLFDISPDLSGGADADPDFCSVCGTDRTTQTPKTLKPKAVLFRQNSMTSVLAVRQKAWMVFFIGTGDGQLIKLAVDKNYQTTCPRVLYRANDDRQVFPKMLLDQVDLKHVYLPLQNQMKHVPVSKCSSYTGVQDCWSAQDPYCIWCGSRRSCTFEDDCKDSDWISIPDDSQPKMVSYKVAKDGTGRITLNIQTHLTVGQKARSNFACQFSISSSELCSTESPPPQFPQCTCILLNSALPAEGLPVTVRVRLGTTQLREQLKLSNCSDIKGPPTSVLCQQCIDAGCGWSKDVCSWADGVEDDVCQKMESGMNYFKPEISSITPSVVSFYGRNHAVLSGNNLSDVTRVRIQADMDCTPQESPVWSNTGGNLTFHIPSSDNKGTVKVCVLLPDGSCHGNAKITYQSSPSCTNIAPSSSWISGRREVTLMGSHLEFVEEVMHSNARQEVRAPRNQNSQHLTYDTPAAEHVGVSSSTVLLKVANETLACSTTIKYYPDPEFISFIDTRTGDDVLITIQKKADKLEMSTAELSVWGVEEGKQYPCIMEAKDTSNEMDSFICEIQKTANVKFQHLKITYGDKTVTLGPPSLIHQVLLTLRFLLIPCVVFVLVIICLWQKRLTAEMNQL